MPKRATRRKVQAPKAPPKLHGVPHNPDQDVEPPSTKAAMESHIQGLNLRCQGPPLAERMDEWMRLMDEGKMDEARAVQTRKGCGYDFGQTVLSEPFDGKEHESTCPKCGVVTSWRSPTLESQKAKSR